MKPAFDAPPAVPRTQGRYPSALLVLSLILLLSLIFSLSRGAVNISLSEAARLLFADAEPDMKREILLNIRLPRILAGALVGGLLALCGVVMQAVVRNPLADPYLMGISSGAFLGASAYLLLIGGAAAFGLAGCALLGALAASVLALGLAARAASGAHRLILAGLAVNILCSSLGGLMIYLSGDARQLQMLVFWMMGSLAPASWSILPLPALTMLAAAVFFLTRGRHLNLLTLGDDEAFALGINPRRCRLALLAVCAPAVAACVTYFGMIGFVGIIIPHIARLIVGGSHPRLMPFAVLAGAVFMVWVDLAARTLTVSEIPLGVLTGLLGSPFFFRLLTRPERR